MLPAASAAFLTRPPDAPAHAGAHDFVAIARDVITQEAHALQTLGAALDGTVQAVVDRLAATRGRIVVSGMGKSGLIGRKVAATFASTGQPALFVHPADASHGDLGMITAADTLLLLSYSGETPELANLITYARDCGIPLIAITSKATSTLAQMATHTLVLPSVQEACPLKLAPTTSTTLMLALGDALAVALLTARGFSPTDFHLFHPGGTLGTQLKRVRDVMHQGAALPWAQPTDPMSEVILTMSAKGYGCVGIGSADYRLCGIITDGDLRRHMGDALLSQPAHQIMTDHPKVVSPDLLLSEALAFMNHHGILCVFVVGADERVLGLLHLHDIFRAGVVSP